MKLGALQPGYLPWLGFFHQIAKTDLFLICDELQYTRYDWRNRNRIRTKEGWLWLIVPIEGRNRLNKRIDEIKIDYSKGWRRKHWLSIKESYQKAPYFEKYKDFWKEIYQRRWTYLADLDMAIILHCLKLLGIGTKIVISSDLKLEDKFSKKVNLDATERIIFFCKELGADEFFEGASGKNYINEDRLKEEGIKLEYQNYHHPVYRQVYQPFIPYLSIVDLLFNEGEKSLEIIMKG